MANPQPVRPNRQTPAATTRRPPEPIRPAPARRPGGTTIEVQVRRRRWRSAFPR